MLHVSNFSGQVHPTDWHGSYCMQLHMGSQICDIIINAKYATTHNINCYQIDISRRLFLPFMILLANLCIMYLLHKPLMVIVYASLSKAVQVSQQVYCLHCSTRSVHQYRKKPYLSLCWRFWINTHHNKALNGHCSYTYTNTKSHTEQDVFGQYQASTAVLGWCIQVEGSLIKRNTKLIGQGLQQKMTLAIR